jgi:signal transduction histidine kinase/CheY-like chemotaxis protein
MRNTELSDDGIVSVIDSAGTFVARNSRNERTDHAIGRPSSGAMMEAAMHRRDEIREATSLEGEAVIVATSFSPYTGWTLALGLPIGHAISRLESSLILWTVGVAGLFGIAVFGSRRIWREVGVPLQALAQNATAFERGEPLRFPVSRIREVREAGRAWELAIEADLGRRAQERLRLAAEARRAEIEQANREKDEVLAALGHELRNPLAAISNGVEVIGASAPPEPSLTAMINVLKRQTGHLGRLLDDMFDLARATFGKLEIRRSPVDLYKLAQQTLSGYDSRRGKIAQIELIGSSVWVEGDATRLDQVIRNLVDNAIKSTTAQGHVVLCVQPDDDQAILRVTDDGIGIAPELLERVFIPFVQDDQKLDRTRGGLGLGLALVRQIVELHGGFVAITSPGVGQGASVIATIDRIDPPAGIEPRAVPVDPPPMKILLVEDQPDLRESLKLLLEIMDLVDVRDAGTGAEALAILEHWQPNVALLDIGLPDIDGFDLGRRIRADPRLAEVRMVAMTGFSENAHREEATESGFDAYLVKPVSRNQLATTLAEVTSGPEHSSTN